MSPFVAYHSTAFRHRDSIRAHGLLLNKPATGRPFGVYVFRPDYGHPTFSRGHRVVWGHRPPSDLWQVAYIGPIVRDYVRAERSDSRLCNPARAPVTYHTYHGWNLMDNTEDRIHKLERAMMKLCDERTAKIAHAQALAKAAND